MVTLVHPRLRVLYPAADPMRDWMVEATPTGERIAYWSDALGPQPSDADLLAVPEADALRLSIPPVTRRQMLTALHRAGLLTTIKAAVAASGDPELQIAFDESQEFQRANPFLATMAAALGKTPAEVDAIFALARTL